MNVAIKHRTEKLKAKIACDVIEKNTKETWSKKKDQEINSWNSPMKLANSPTHQI